MDSREEIIVGMNQFAEKSSVKTPILKMSPALERGQVARLKKFKKSRNQKVVVKHLELIRIAAGGSDNLMPLFVSALENRVTLGEISHALRDVFGLYKENIVI